MSDKAVRKALADIESALGVLKGTLGQPDVSEKPAAKAAPKVKAAKEPTSLKEHAKAALEAKKFHHKSKEHAFLKEYVDSKSRPKKEVAEKVSVLLGLSKAKAPEAAPAKASKAAPSGNLKAQAKAALDSGKHKGSEAETLAAYVKSKKDGRSEEGRAEANAVRAILGLPLAAKPGPAKKAEAKAPAKKESKPPKAEKAPKAPKAAKAKDGNLKDQVTAAIEAKKFHHKSKEHATLTAFLTSKHDGRSAEGKAEAAAVREILGLPPAKKPGPAKSAEPKPKKATSSGKGDADAASDSPKPSPTKSTGAKPRAIEAVEAVLASGTMNAAEVVTALTEKGWLPDSNDPKTYISFILSQNKDKFERDPSKPRGFYRLVGAKGEAAPEQAPPPPSKEPEAPPKANGSANGTNGAHTAPVEELPTAAETGDDDDNPFDDSVLS